MDFKRIFRGPIIWILLVLVLGGIGFNLLTTSNSREITTQEGLSLLGGDTVEKVQIVDGEQRVDLTLSSAFKDFGTNVQFYYVVAARARGADRRHRQRREVRRRGSAGQLADRPAADPDHRSA